METTSILFSRNSLDHYQRNRPLTPLVGIEVAALAIPTLGYTLLSSLNWMYSFGSHHYSPVFAFFSMATVIGIERVVGWLGRSSFFDHSHKPYNLTVARASVGAFLLSTSIIAFYLSYNLPAEGQLARDWTLLTRPVSQHDLLERIPLE
jgi:hypothetical protein